MNGVNNLNKRKMIFEKKGMHVIVPLNPAEGSCYTKLVRDFMEDYDDVDNIYKITMQNEEWINLTDDG